MAMGSAWSPDDHQKLPIFSHFKPKIHWHLGGSTAF